MSKSRNGPRKPATKFPHLRKQMQKNAQIKSTLDKSPFAQTKRPGRKLP